MNKYWEEKFANIDIPPISEKEIQEFYDVACQEMKRMGATEDQIGLLGKESVKYAIINKHKPEDLAWAILQ